MTRICAAFCGTGKTYIVEKTDIKAIEVEYWKYKNMQQEYVAEIRKHIGNVDYIFIATDPEGLSLLHNEGFDITLIYPEIELRNDYLDRYIQRDSPYDFIGVFMKYWEPWLNELKNITYCKHIVLKKNEYLFNILQHELV